VGASTVVGVVLLLVRIVCCGCWDDDHTEVEVVGEPQQRLLAEDMRVETGVEQLTLYD
jgi:hypothetical protein